LEASAIHAPSGLGRISAHGPLLRLRSDDQLVALFRMGYDEAFRAIHDRYRQRLFAYTRQMLGASRSDAEDVLQDVFLRAYAALRDDDRPVTIRAWLYRVAHNRCIDHLRRPVPAAAEVYELSRTPQHDPLDETERREDLRRLVQDVQRLPEQQRSALLMREMDGLSYAELADALRTSIPAIKSLLVRARIGLVEAGEARDTACADIRSELTRAHSRGVRASGRSRRHMRDCVGCREYRSGLRVVDQGLAALSPGGGGPLATIAKLLGIGGASSGAAAGAGVSMGGSAAVVGGATAATATKVAAIVCCAAVVGGGAVEVRDRVTAAPHQTAATPRQPAVVRAAAASVVVKPPPLRAANPLAERHAPVVDGAKDRVKALVETPAASTALLAAPEEIQTGGAMAPDEPLSSPATQTDGTEGESSASDPSDSSSPATTSDPPPAPVDSGAGGSDGSGSGSGAGAGSTAAGSTGAGSTAGAAGSGEGGGSAGASGAASASGSAGGSGAGGGAGAPTG
jgi:RNA polymerase sigma factor (sigma-70 family)